jgi:formamidopyrimidine-DNA glycosylase
MMLIYVILCCIVIRKGAGIMLEIPESLTVAKQLNDTVRGRTVRRVLANTSPHKFAFFNGDPAGYDALLSDREIGDSVGLGSQLEIAIGDRRLVIGDGASLRYYESAIDTPEKHQLLVELDGGGALVSTIQMYGMIYAFIDGTYDNKFYLIAREKPLPVTDAFSRAYFGVLRTADTDKLAAKAFLATEQRIPGLGNGVLQDILFRARVHPKRKIGTLSEAEYDLLYQAVRSTLKEMTEQGGRDTEKDLFGNQGGYKTILSKNTVGKPCQVCGATIEKAPYMGGAVYWCPSCQPM